MAQRVKKQTPAQSLQNEKFNIDHSGGRSASKSPSRVNVSHTTPRRTRAAAENQENDSMDVDHSPPKTRKVNFTSSSDPISRKKLDFSEVEQHPSRQHLHDDVVMDDIHSSGSSTGDLTHRITRMIVSQCGGRKRKKKELQDQSDEEMDDDSLTQGPDAKRSPCELDFNKLKKLMDKMDHDQEQNISSLDDFYDQWDQLFKFTEYNVLITGKGSKIAVIKNYLNRQSIDKVVLVHGTFSATSAKSIFKEVEDKLKLKLPPKRAAMSPLQYARELGAAASQQKQTLLLVIHGLDGTSLREAIQQSTLANFVDAGGERIKLLATVDHVNHGLLWNSEVRSLYSFVPYNVDTFMTYKKEIEDSAPGLLGMEVKSAAESHTLSSLEVFWKALPTTAQRELSLLAVLSTKNAEGIVETSQLFEEARSKMITHSRASLNQHLTEFKDHHLITINQGVIKVVIDRSLLLHFMENQGMDLD